MTEEPEKEPAIEQEKPIDEVFCANCQRANLLIVGILTRKTKERFILSRCVDCGLLYYIPLNSSDFKKNSIKKIKKEKPSYV